MKQSYKKYIAGLLLFGSSGVLASFIDLGSSDIVMLRTVLGAGMLGMLFRLLRHESAEHTRGLRFIALSGLAMASGWGCSSTTAGR